MAPMAALVRGKPSQTPLSMRIRRSFGLVAVVQDWAEGIRPVRLSLNPPAALLGWSAGRLLVGDDARRPTLGSALGFRVPSSCCPAWSHAGLAGHSALHHERLGVA